MPLRYLKGRWNERRGNAYGDWGASWWFFEVGSDGYPVRQIEVFDDGTVLKYDRDHVHDTYGGLGDQSLYPLEPELIEITPAEFEAEWTARCAKNE